jgi:hypothetical protein
MGRTKTAPPPVDHDELTEARGAHQALLDRIDADGQVTPLELAEAEAAIRLAETRTDLLDRRAAAEAEERRVARIRAIYADLTDGELVTKAGAAVAAYDKLMAAAAELHAALASLDAQISTARRELRQLGEMPEGVDIVVTSDRLAVNGVQLSTSPDRPTLLVGFAVGEALGDRSQAAKIRDGIKHTYGGLHLRTVRAIAGMV